MICVIATIHVTDGRREEFLEEFRKIVPLVCEEAGCIEYAPMVDIPTELDAQAEPVESSVFVVEKWESVDALEAHLVAPHMLEYRKRVKELVKGAEIRILEPA
jgi:quinol monooxygenase YgiN